jgi:hypothetical protein
MTLVLTASLFTDNEYAVNYGNKRATFTIIDESFYYNASLTLDINRIVCVVRTYADDGSVESDVLGSMVIGIGDTVVGVTTTDTTLLGKLLNKDNMASCTVELYE